MDKSAAIHMLEIVADGLKDLHRQVVFVGGATVALYVDDPAVSTPRPTDDVDCTVEIASRTDYYQLEKEVRQLGFKNQATGTGPICRWTYSGITVDIIPSKGSVFGFKNTWYPPGIANAEKVTLPSKSEIAVFTLPYFLASKFEAYRDRGRNDPRTSSDFEDIVFVLDGCLAAKEKLLAAPEDVRRFLATEYERLSASPGFEEGITAHLGAERNRGARSARIVDILASVRSR